MGKIIAVVSGKGGVGKTTLALNLGYAFTQFGRNTLVVEANFKSPHFGVVLGFPEVEKTLHSVVEKKHHITEAAYLHYSGLKVVLAHFAGKHHPSSQQYEELEKALEELKEKIEIVIVDTPPSHVHETHHVIKVADFVLLITTPELPSVLEVMKNKKIAEYYHKEIVGVVVNRHENKPFVMKTKSIEKMLEVPILEIVPEDDKVKESILMKHPVTFAFPEAPASEAFKRLAAKLLGKPYEPKKEVPEVKKHPFFYNLVRKLS